MGTTAKKENMSDNCFYFYILQCNDDSYYVGHTDDLEKRLSDHQMGRFEGYTSTRLPVKLVYSQSFGSRDEAWVAEQKVKKWTRRKKEVLIRLGFLGFKKLNT